MRWLTLVLVAAFLAGCSRPAPPSVDQNAQLQMIETLKAENTRHLSQNEANLERIGRLERQVVQQQETIDLLVGQKKELLRNSGYESTLRLVYQRLQAGDIGPLRYLLPAEGYIEGGVQEGQHSTYRGYDSASQLDLRPFAEYARRHPMETGTFSIIATMPDYGWAVVMFPDGTHFRIMFHGWRVIKVLASDRGIEMS